MESPAATIDVVGHIPLEPSKTLDPSETHSPNFDEGGRQGASPTAIPKFWSSTVLIFRPMRQMKFPELSINRPKDVQNKTANQLVQQTTLLSPGKLYRKFLFLLEALPFVLSILYLLMDKICYLGSM
ncbi:hypothetical protein CARUB_v10021148mg [Capsella rubella]|uniref:Uncharacterized protein n=1 Tax=Capsella rubella TaxID=81985 RepID=R0GJF1_9BRAS|nr:hypothetical protein CARUB_v10021148mg [Capsella rubella]